MFYRLLCSVFLWFCFVAAAVGQSSTSVSGVVTDSTGALVIGSTVTLTNTDTAATRVDHTDKQGRYEFVQISPGSYTVSAVQDGFGKVTTDNVQLAVATPATVNLTLTLSSNDTVVDVTDSAAQVNTTDASLGTAFSTTAIQELPMEGHDVTALLGLQPGVTFITLPQPGLPNDPRSGSVNGGKSDQSNVLLDGVDSNDQLIRTSFTSVMRITADSVQEFRTITSNPGAEMGFSSGAQVTIVTKSGTNKWHGLAYEYNRNTALEANLFLNKRSNLARPALLRNVFGGTFGGPIKKDKLFFFLAYEGRREASATTQKRTVPTALFKQGIFTYQATAGGTGTETPDQIKALDPQGIGESAAALADLQKYPDPNASGGDTLNTSGFTFNAKTPLKYNTYFARFDYHIDSAGRHTIFGRGNYQLDNYANGAPQFPGQPPGSVLVNFTKGYAFNYTWVVTPNIVNNARFGFTRESSGHTGPQTSGTVTFNMITPLYPSGGSSSTQTGGTAGFNQLPVYDLRDDLTWNKGRHSLGIGGEIFLLHNNSETNSNSFSSGLTNGLDLIDDGGQLIPSYASKTTNYERQIANIMGLVAQLTRRNNYDKTGATLPEGTVIKRDFVQNHYDLYVQDNWKARPNLTLSAGLRYSMVPAIKEANGYNVSATTPAATWFAKRGQLAAQGLSDSGAPLISYDLATNDHIPYYSFKNDFQPRVSFAYSPNFESGIMRALTGGAGKMSIRGGFGMFYDAFGQTLAQNFSSAAGFSLASSNPASQPIQNVPRYTGFYDLPLTSPLFPAPLPGGFPQTVAVGSKAQASTADSTLKAPYTFAQNLTMSREFRGGFLLQVSYVGRESRHSLIGEDLGAPTDLVDTASGTDYYTAAKVLAKYAQAKTPAASVPNVPYWENLWPGAASAGVSATQGVYSQFVSNLNDWTSALVALDQSCKPSCSKLGPNALWSPQFEDLSALRSIGMGSYNSFQIVLNKTFSHGYQVGGNYTFSHCIDLASSPESGGSGSGAGQINNSWSPNHQRAVCDYDLRHQIQANTVAELPFGKGKAFGTNANPVVNAFIGGWQLTSIFRDTTGFPTSVGDNVGYPNLWGNQGYATLTGTLPKGKGPKGQMFSNPAAAYAAYSATLPGDSGTRNNLRSDGLFTIDVGIDKRWQLFSLREQPNTLQFRLEGFNITNTARFDAKISSASLSYGVPGTFGQYAGPKQFVDPRSFQAVLRYEF